METAKLWPVLLLALSAASAQPGGEPPPIDQVVEAQLSALDTGELEQFLHSLDAEIQPYLPEFRPSPGQVGRLDPANLGRQLLTRLARELALNAHLLGELVLLGVICVLLAQLGNSFAPQGLSRLAFHICYLIMITLAANSFLATVRLGRGAIRDLVGFMYALLPVVCTLLASIGAAATSALFHPLVLAGVAAVGRLVQTVVFPLAMLAAAVTIVSHLSEGFSLSKLATLLRDLAVGLTGATLAGFVGVLTVRGVTAAAADGVTLRTAKYVSGTFVPVVGKGLADAMESVAGCSLVLKNAVGAFGSWTLLVLTAFPLIKILAVVAIYRLAAALIQPLGETRLVEALHAIGNSFLLIFGVTALVGLAFFLGLTILVTLGNLAYALR